MCIFIMLLLCLTVCLCVYTGWRSTLRLPRLLLFSLFLLISVTLFRARYVLFKRIINDSLITIIIKTLGCVRACMEGLHSLRKVVVTRSRGIEFLMIFAP